MLRAGQGKHEKAGRAGRRPGGPEGPPGRLGLPERERVLIRVRFDRPSTLSGRLRVPSSKSYTHRAYLAALLPGGGMVRHPLRSEDTDATRQCLRGFNARVESHGDDVTVESPSRLRSTRPEFDASESGTLLRFLIPWLSVLPGPDEVRITGHGSLTGRSNEEVLDSMRGAGFKIDAAGSRGELPITCYPGQSLPGEPVPVSAETTSQLLSGWLLALAARGGGELRRTTELVSAPYVTLTERVLARAGFTVEHPAPDRYRVPDGPARTLEYEVPGDYSSAAFLIAGGVLTGGTVRLDGLVPDDPQGDRRIVSLLREQGAELTWDEGTHQLVGSGPFRPPGFRIDASDCPDLVPVLAVLGCFARGPVELENIGHLSNKESDRINRTCEELSRAGLDVRAASNRISIHPPEDPPRWEGTHRLHAHNDHRLAMAFSVLGMVCGGVEVEGAQCVAKSYPGFFEDLRSLGVAFEEETGG